MAIKDSPLSIIGVPLDLGAENLGVYIGPGAFKKLGVSKKLKTVGFKVSSFEEIPVRPRDQLNPGSPNLKYLDEIVRVNEDLARQVNDLIDKQNRVIVLGGDHSINLGAFSGASVALNGQIGLIYFDAHGDINTDKTTLTGNIHGMHLASLMGYGANELVNLYKPAIKLDKNNLLHIGGSDFDKAESQLVKDEKLDFFTLFDILTLGFGALIDKIKVLSNRLPNIWVSLDLDCIDRVFAPAAAMPNAKGLSYREIAILTEYIGQHCNVVGLDIVEYNPLNDKANKTAELGIELIAKLMGKDYSWYTNYLARNRLSS